VPGTSPASFQRDLFGFVGGVPVPDPLPGPLRLGAVAVKFPLAVARVPRRLTRLRRETDRWWRATVSAGSAELSMDEALLLLGAAQARLQQNMRAHIFVSMLAQVTFDRLAAVASGAGMTGFEIHLTTGYGSMEEGRSLEDLWDVAGGRMELAEFLARHGYHGPREGELSSVVWREDLRPVHALLARFRELDPADAPTARAGRQRAEAEAAEAQLLARVKPARRPAVRMLLRSTGRYMLLREVGKAAYLQAIDGARFAARAMGDRLVEAGVLDARDDVFQLTCDELRGGLGAGTRELVAARRERWASYAELDVPENWTGQLVRDYLVPAPVADAADGRRRVEGVGVSPGIVEGRAVVIVDPATSGDAVQPGDIVVCPWTDPSWAPTMLVSSGFVIDTGGALSHGAIIARELGVPCVIGAVDATKRLRTGDLIRVDGAAGTVDIISRAEA
jgi:pyruvate,water dikinase